MRWTKRSAAVVLMLFGLVAACGSDGTEARVETETPTVATEDGDPPPACTPPDGPPLSVEVGSTTDPSGHSTTATPTTVTATSPPDPTTTPSEPDPTTTPADPELAAAQDRLVGLGYWLGEVDGRAGPNTAHATTAFQKAEGLPRTGELDDATLQRLTAATRPEHRNLGHGLEVDLERQILLVVSDGRVHWTFDIATGSSATPTPTGDYEIYREIDGYRHAPLGTLYRPKYFNGGIAFHGYTSVPSQPASHGCIRLTYEAMDFVWEADLAPIGSMVSVY